MSETTKLLGSIDLQNFDTSVRPQDDLFRYVNGKWLEEHVIPADRPVDGAFYALRDKSEEEVRALIEQCAAGQITDDTAAKIGALYGAFMDEERMESESLPALTKLAAPLWQAGDHQALALEVSRLATAGMLEGFFGFEVEADPNDPANYVIHCYQSGLSLPERAYYLEEIHTEVLPKFRAHVEKMWRLSGWEQAEAGEVAQVVFDFESALATLHWDNVKSRDADATNNPMTWAELQALAPGLDWDAFLAAGDLPRELFAKVHVMMPDYLTKAVELWNNTDLRQLQIWLAWQLLHSQARFLGRDLVEENFDFYGRILSGSPELRQRWKRGVALVEGVFGEAIGRLYVERHFPASAKEKMEQLVADLVEAYRRSITNLEWMSPVTKEKALEKLGAFTPKIGYPDKWRDYSALVLDQETLLENLVKIGQFETAYWMDKLAHPVDRSLWYMTPQTVNAYYHPTMNEIVFPAAILQGPFFDEAADPAINYGAIGAVIGHEIGHGFDDQGSKYDGQGRLRDWWTDTDRTEFTARTQALIDQYEAFVPAGLPAEHHVNGALTIGENIGDLGGLSIAWKAYCLYLEREGISDPAAAPVIEGLSAAQRFLYSWARVWRSKARPEYAMQLLAIDPHSPAEFRCNGVVRNLDLFAQTFGSAPGDGLYLDPAQRVTIW